VLRPIEPEDTSFIGKWLNDGVVTYYMFYGQRPLTTAQVLKIIEAETESPNNAVFLVEDRSETKPIGFAGLYDIHLTARKAEFRVLLGEKEYWNRGYGTEVTELLTYYGFDRLNLNRLWLGVTSENQAAIQAYQKAGYKMEGVLRQDIYRNSRYYDSVRMGILREEYYPELHARHQKRFGVLLPFRPSEGRAAK
jgi:RimJ/RimL family protein N-acetyltransferase